MSNKCRSTRLLSVHIRQTRGDLRSSSAASSPVVPCYATGRMPPPRPSSRPLEVCSDDQTCKIGRQCNERTPCSCWMPTNSRDDCADHICIVHRVFCVPFTLRDAEVNGLVAVGGKKTTREKNHQKPLLSIQPRITGKVGCYTQYLRTWRLRSHECPLAHSHDSHRVGGRRSLANETQQGTSVVRRNQIAVPLLSSDRAEGSGSSLLRVVPWPKRWICKLCQGR